MQRTESNSKNNRPTYSIQLVEAFQKLIVNDIWQEAQLTSQRSSGDHETHHLEGVSNSGKMILGEVLEEGHRLEEGDVVFVFLESRPLHYQLVDASVQHPYFRFRYS